MGRWPNREEADKILCEWMKNKNLRKHGYAVEAAMRAYAAKLGADPERWGAVGLLHDFDYEKYPKLEDHPFKGVEFLRAAGFDEELIGGVMAHAEHTHTPRDTPMKKVIYAVDELTGLIVAVTLVRPSKKLADVSVESVKKKWNEKQFAAGVDRRQIEQGAAELGVGLDEHIATVLSAMQSISDKLGL
jgi:putative nucleotidyltransferase with HDIG domain